MSDLERRLAWLVLQPHPFTADDLTDNGGVAIDPTHAPNGPQSGIGALIQWAHRERLIEWTGATVKSKAPKRKGGKIQIWIGTAKGKAWARRVLGELDQRRIRADPLAEPSTSQRYGPERKQRATTRPDVSAGDNRPGEPECHQLRFGDSVSPQPSTAKEHS